MDLILDTEDTQKLEASVFEGCAQLKSNELVDIWGEKIQIVYTYQARLHSWPPIFRVSVERRGSRSWNR